MSADRLIADVARARQLPANRFPVFIRFLVDIPDLDRLLVWVGCWVAGWKISSIEPVTTKQEWRAVRAEVFRTD